MIYKTDLKQLHPSQLLMFCPWLSNPLLESRPGWNDLVQNLCIEAGAKIDVPHM